MNLHLAPFSKSHLAPAAELVSARVRRLRQRLPLLPPAYESPKPLLAWLQELFAERPGVVSLQDARIDGILLAFQLPRFFGQAAAYSPVWANGALPGSSPQLCQELYTHLAQRWVAEGLRAHVVTVLEGDPAELHAWQWLGFSMLNVDAVRAIQPIPGEPPESVRLRPASRADLPIIMEMAGELQAHLAASPAYFPHDAEDIAPQFEGEGYAIWLAEAGDQPVGYLAVEPGEESECELLRDPRSIYISGAYTHPAWRGRGVARMLVNQALAWAEARGVARCAVDFEAANPPAARFWMRWFSPVAYSLIRFIQGLDLS